MPTYRSLLTTVNLTVSVPAQPTTIISSAENDSSTATGFSYVPVALGEEALCIPGEDSHVSFLGEPPSYPFFMVRAGKDIFKDTHDARGVRTRSSTSAVSEVKAGGSAGRKSEPLKPIAVRRKSTDSTSTVNSSYMILDYTSPSVPKPISNIQPVLAPRTLGVVVNLSPDSFLSPSPPTGGLPRTKRRGDLQDIQISVFFNGEFCGSELVPKRSISTPSERIRLFSGRRVGQKEERAWVIIPPGQGPDGELRDVLGKRIKSIYPTPQSRWDAIGKSLDQEAAGWLTDSRGRKTYTGEYLTSLAKLPMPEEVARMERPGGQRYGVIDVLITVGRGRKLESNHHYINAPMRMLDPCFTPRLDKTRPGEVLAGAADNSIMPPPPTPFQASPHPANTSTRRLGRHKEGSPVPKSQQAGGNKLRLSRGWSTTNKPQTQHSTRIVHDPRAAPQGLTLVKAGDPPLPPSHKVAAASPLLRTPVPIPPLIYTHIKPPTTSQKTTSASPRPSPRKRTPSARKTAAKKALASTTPSNPSTSSAPRKRFHAPDSTAGVLQPGLKRLALSPPASQTTGDSPTIPETPLHLPQYGPARLPSATQWFEELRTSAARAEQAAARSGLGPATPASAASSALLGRKSTQKPPRSRYQSPLSTVGSHASTPPSSRGKASILIDAARNIVGREWTPSVLSSDAVLTYAEGGRWGDDEGGVAGSATGGSGAVRDAMGAATGATASPAAAAAAGGSTAVDKARIREKGLREVKSARMGEFGEVGVLMGVRFVVGGN